MASASASSLFPCPECNFVIVGPNDSKLGMHVSGNDLKCSAQKSNSTLFLFMNYSSLIGFYRAFLF